MAGVDEPNVHVLAMDGTSDDIDVPFKKMFEDLEFKKKYGINSINSVNWVYTYLLLSLAHSLTHSLNYILGPHHGADSQLLFFLFPGIGFITERGRRLT